MYLEMLQQKYGSGLEKSSAALLGRGAQALGRGISGLGSKLSGAGIKLPESVAKHLTGLGSKLSDAGLTLADPVLRRMAMEGFKANNKLYAALLKNLAQTSPARTAMLGSGLVGTGLGAGYLANELTQQ